MADIGFISDEVETAKPSDSHDPIPAGTYTAAILDSEIVDTGGGTGQQLKLKWKVLEGDHKGRLVFDRVTLRNPTAQAVEIGVRQLKSIAIAVGHTGRLTDSSVLHGTPCSIKVKIRPAGTNPKDGKSYEASNEIKEYKPLGSAPSLNAQAAASGAAVAAPKALTGAAVGTPNKPAAPPWMKQ